VTDTPRHPHDAGDGSGGTEAAAAEPAAAEPAAAELAAGEPGQGELPMPFGDDYAADPAAVWERLLRAGPVHRVATPDGPPAWVVTAYREVHAGLLDERLSVCAVDARGVDYKGFDLPPALQAHLLNREPPDHTRLRALVAPAISPQQVDRFRPAVLDVVDALVEPIAAAGAGDLVADLAVPLPLFVICDVLGVPAAQRSELLEWAGRLLAAEPSQAPRARDTLAEMLRIVAGIIDTKRQPAARPHEHTGVTDGADAANVVETADLLTLLVRAHDDDGLLSGDELTSMIFYLLFVWYEVSVDLLSNGLLRLLRHPDEVAALRRSPESIGAAVEELLRLETPQALAAPRFPTRDVEIAGTRIPAGDTVLLSLAAADLDPARFPAGAGLDLDQATRAHLAFGQGVHTCLGAPLVRLQTELAIATLLQRCDALRLAIEPQHLRWRHGFRHRGLRELPITCQPQPPSAPTPPSTPTRDT
jgi:cytochrome P450